MFNQKLFLFFLFLGISSPLYTMQNWFLYKKLNQYHYTKNSLNNSFSSAIVEELQKKGLFTKKMDKSRIENYLAQRTNPDCIIQFQKKECFYNRSEKTTPLIAAIENHKIDLVYTLLKYRANVNRGDENDLLNQERLIWTKPLLVNLLTMRNSFSYIPNLDILQRLQNQRIDLIIWEHLLEHGASLENLDNCDNNIFHVLPLSLIRISISPIIEKIFTHAHFDSKKESPHLQHKIITLLCTFKQKNIPKDIQFLIFSHLPEYFHHRRLYNELFTKKYVTLPYNIIQLHIRTEQFKNILQHKNKEGETPLQILRRFIDGNIIKKELTPYLNGIKFQEDFDQFVAAYHAIPNLEDSIQKLSQLELIVGFDNLVFKRYRYNVIKKHCKSLNNPNSLG